MKFGTRPILAGCLLLAAACVDGYVEDETDLEREEQDIAIERWDPQSQQLLGARKYGSLDLDTAHTIGLLDLVDRGANGFTTAAGVDSTSWRLLPGGVSLSSDGELTFRVQLVATSATEARRRYKVEVRVPGSEAFVPYCTNASDTAYAIQGAFHPFGWFYDNQYGISFACTGGAAAKAIRWGFAPVAPTPSTGGEADGQVFVAATSMARADFCGVGKHHTVAGTKIGFADLADFTAGGTAGPPPSNGGTYRFEAAWAGNTVEFGTRGKAVCISKWRWAALTANECGAVLHDPRFDEFRRNPFCEELSRDADDSQVSDADVAVMQRRGAMMFSWSADQDHETLWAWWNPLEPTGALVTTDEGAPGYGGQAPSQFPGMSAVGLSTQRVGQIFQYRPDQPPPPYTKKLVLYRSVFGGSAYRTTTDDTIDDAVCSGIFCLASWQRVRDVGYLSSYARPGAVRVQTFQKGSQYRLVRVDEPDVLGRVDQEQDARNNGWTPLNHEGYALY